MTNIWRLLAWFTTKLRGIFTSLSIRCEELLFWLYRKIDGSKDDIQKEIERFSEDVNKFYLLPKSKSGALIDGKYSGLVETYFLLKQAVSLYEAHSKALPLQVFNEMRNALDHFIRSQIGDKENETRHIKKSEDHLQRALFDVIKVTCAFYDAETKKKHKLFPNKALSLVDNGQYIKEYYELHAKGQECFTIAKLEDYQLGSGSQKEEEVRRLYIQALIAHKDLHIFQSNNFGKLHWGLGKLGLGILLTIILGMIASVAVYVLIELEILSV